MTKYIATEGSDYLRTENSNFLVTEDSISPGDIPIPIVTSVLPATGPTTGGTAVSIVGQNFTGVTAVTIGGTTATSIIFISDTNITAVTPSGIPGTASVVVTTSNGFNIPNSLFTYTAITNCLSIGDYVTSITLKETTTSTPITSGYTYATSIQGVVGSPIGVSPADVLNNFSLFVFFGNSQEIEINQVTSNTLITFPITYNWPGAYEVKLVVVPKNGCALSTFTKTFTAVNYVTDKLTWNNSNWPDMTPLNINNGAVYHGFQSCLPGPLNNATALTFNYTISNLLSSNIIFNLYSENSLSQPWEAVLNNKYAQLRPRWRFTDLNNNYTSSISAFNSTPIYIDPLGNISDSVNGILVGYTGTVDFYYIDDIPSLNYNNGFVYPVLPTLWVIYDTINISNSQDKNDGGAPSYSNSTVILSSYFYVKNLSADHFNITVNGGSISLPETAWPDTDTTFIATINSAITSSSSFSNITLLNYPLLGTLNSTIFATVTPSAAATVYTSGFNFNRYDSVSRDSGGYFKNIISTLPLSSLLLSSGTLSTTLTLSAQILKTIIEPPPAIGGYYTASNAYNNITYALSTVSLKGITSFNVNNFYKNYFVRKINENFNYGSQLQSYALQDFIASDTNLITFLSAVAGDNVHPTENFGTVAYEKIANFVLNNQDPTTSNVNQLYSLASMIDTEFDNYNYNLPPVLQRQFDLYSNSKERLWGAREKYNTNFNAITDHVNLGNALTAIPLSTTVVAGQKVVLNDIFNSNFYELIEIPLITSYASITANNMQAYFPPANQLSFPLNSYPLSSFYGWGVKTPVATNYRFFVYSSHPTNTPVNSLIDWTTYTDSLSTTLNENIPLSAWYADGGVLENIYNYYISKGLNLIGNSYYGLTGLLPQT